MPAPPQPTHPPTLNSPPSAQVRWPSINRPLPLVGTDCHQPTTTPAQPKRVVGADASHLSNSPRQTRRGKRRRLGHTLMRGSIAFPTEHGRWWTRESSHTQDMFQTAIQRLSTGQSACTSPLPHPVHMLPPQPHVQGWSCSCLLPRAPQQGLRDNADHYVVQTLLPPAQHRPGRRNGAASGTFCLIGVLGRSFKDFNLRDIVSSLQNGFIKTVAP